MTNIPKNKQKKFNNYKNSIKQNQNNNINKMKSINIIYNKYSKKTKYKNKMIKCQIKKLQKILYKNLY